MATIEQLQKLAEELTEELENTSASLDNVLVHLGSKMPTADRYARTQRVARNRALIKKARRLLENRHDG